MALDNWRVQLHACGDHELATALVRSLESLFQADLHRLTVDASERNIVQRLAAHLSSQGLLAPDGKPWDVDVEYNRQGARVKTINGMQVVVPDLILHRVGTDQNFLALELKKGAAAEANEDDLAKLWAYRQPDQLNYCHALFLRLGVEAEAGTVSSIVWV